MGGGGGGGGATSSVMYTNLVPTYISGFQGWVEAYMAEAQYIGLTVPNYTVYSGPTYAAQDANETDGISALATRGQYGSSVELDGKTYLQNLFADSYFGANPKLDDAYSAQIDELLQELNEVVLPAIRDQYAFAYGGSQHNIAEARATQKTTEKIMEIARLYYEDYVRERGAQQAGMKHITPYGLQCIRDMEMLRQAGVFAREYAQGGLETAWQKWNEDQIIPIRNLDILGNAVKTVVGTTRTSSTQFFKPPKLAQIAGIALTGVSLYSMFTGTSVNPYLKGAAAPKELPSTTESNPDLGFSAGIGPEGT